MSFIQALLLGLLQGVTELFPISSLGHSVIITSLFHFPLTPSDSSFVPFLALLHVGTAAALFILYRKEWMAIIAGFLRASVRGTIQNEHERLAMLLLVATIPAGILGFVFETPLKVLFGEPLIAAAFLCVNGLVLLIAERMRRRQEQRTNMDEPSFASCDTLSFRNALFIGVVQVFALIPGISRSGITMTSGLFAGLRHQEAAKFSFLLATPIIGAAGVLEIPQLSLSSTQWTMYAASAVIAGIAAFVSAAFLVRSFKTGRLDPYGYYCLVAGAIALVVIH